MATQKKHKRNSNAWVIGIGVVVVVIIVMCFIFSSESTPDKIPIGITSEVVSAVVVEVRESVYSADKIKVEYAGISAIFENGKLVAKYKNNIGSLIDVVMITRTFKDGSKDRYLVFNDTVYNGGALK